MFMALLIPFASINAQSIENYTEEQLKQAGGLENLLENNQKDAEKEKKMYENFESIGTELNNSATMSANNERGKLCLLGVCILTTGDIVRQENNYYCGPASVKQSLNFIIGDNATASQSYYASNMGTNSTEGTYVYKIAEELDKHQSVNDYGWREILNGTDTLWNPVYYDIQTAQVPMIARVDTSKLEVYNGIQLTHYVTVYGYNTTGSKSIAYLDSYDGIDGVFGQQADTLNNFYMAASYLIW